MTFAKLKSVKVMAILAEQSSDAPKMAEQSSDAPKMAEQSSDAPKMAEQSSVAARTPLTYTFAGAKV